MEHFIEKLRKRFVVGKTVIDSKIHFDGCKVEQEPTGSIKMSMIRYLERLKPIAISRSPKMERRQRATPSELQKYRSLAFTLIYLGNGVLPQAAFVTSALQQMVPRVTVEQLVTANDMLTELLKLNPWIRFRAANKSEDVIEVLI